MSALASAASGSACLWGLLAAGSALAAEPVLYGGVGPDVEAASHAAADASDTEAETRWFLDPFTPLAGDVYPLGGARFAPCDGSPLTMAEFEAASARGLEQLDQILPEEASETLEAAARRLPCLESPPPAEALARFEFHRGIAALTRRDRDAEVGRRAFGAAVTANPDTPWNEDYPAFPRSVFFEAKVELLTAPRARVWVVPAPELSVHLEGNLLSTSAEGTEVLAGAHLMHLRSASGTWSGVVELPPGGQLVVGESEGLWQTIVSQADSDSANARAFAVRGATVAAHGGPVRVVRPGAVAALGEGGSLGTWSDEGPYKARLLIELGMAWLFLDKRIESPPVDLANPSDHWGEPAIGIALQLHPVFSVRVGGGLAFSGPFEVEGVGRTRLMLATQVGAAAEAPSGNVRPGARLDLDVLLPGRLPIGGEPSFVILAGPSVSGTLAGRLTDLVWLQCEAGIGWAGSVRAGAAVRLQLRLPPFR